MPRSRDQADTDQLLIRFGIHLRDARIKHNLTQDDVAKLTGLDQAHLSRIENGKQNLTMETMVRLADVVHANVRDLLRPIPETDSPPDSDAPE